MKVMISFWKKSMEQAENGWLDIMVESSFCICRGFSNFFKLYLLKKQKKKGNLSSIGQLRKCPQQPELGRPKPRTKLNLDLPHVWQG